MNAHASGETVTCRLKVAIKVPCRGRTLELLVPCEAAAGHLGRCDAPKLQAAALSGTDTAVERPYAELDH